MARRCSLPMEWLTTAAPVVVAIVAVVVALVWRQGWREGSTVEMTGGENTLGAMEHQRPPGEFTE